MPPLLLYLLLLLEQSTASQYSKEIQRYDGWFNNLVNPAWGSTGSRLTREAPANYADGVYLMNTSLPSARLLSNLVFSGEPGERNSRNMTTMFVFFSQVVGFEILSTGQVSCPLEFADIPVPKCDQTFDVTCGGKSKLPFMRANYDGSTGSGLNSPREQINGKTSWIDGSFVYSTQEPWVASQRSFKNGRFLEGDMGYPPKNSRHLPMSNPPPPQIHRLMNPARLYVLGDQRVNENPGTLSFGLILYRWHNVQAERIQRQNPDWSDEDVFQAARRWVIAALQKVIIYDFVPALLGDSSAIPAYTKYMPRVPPGVSQSFSSAFRVVQSLMPPAIFLRKRGAVCDFRLDIDGYSTLRMCQNWWNAQDTIEQFSVDEVILGMASQVAEKADTVVVEDLRDFLWGPMQFSRTDAVSDAIMRARDNGLPPYNAMRRTFGLPPRTWDTINTSFYAKNQSLFDSLSALYAGDISSLDAYVGGMLEGGDDDGPGELFRAIISDQFLRLRDSDRFWFENRLNGLFTDEEIAQIRNITLRDIIRDTTDISEHMLQQDVFFWRQGDPCPQPFQVNTTGLDQCVPVMHYSYFSGSEVAYIFTLVGLGIIPLVLFGIGCALVQRRKSLGWDSSFDNLPLAGASSTFNPKNKLRMPAYEWLEETFVRQVMVEFEPGSLLVRKPSGGVLRKIIFPKGGNVLVTYTESESSRRFGPYCLITLPKTHDLILRLPSEKHLSVFLAHLNGTMTAIGGTVEAIPESNQQILDKAETKGRRQARLDNFFREAYARAFDMPQMSDSTSPTAGDNSVLEESITAYELAQAMGMKEDDLFIRRMFSVCKKDADEELSFAEFLSVLKKFTKGKPSEKYSFLFSLCDVKGEGHVDRHEFATFMKSLNKVVGVRMDNEQQERLVEIMLKRAGVSSTSLTEEDIASIFSEVDREQPVTMQIKGQQLTVGVDQDRISLNSFSLPPTDPSILFPESIFARVCAIIETHRQHIAILTVFVFLNLFLFTQRFWHFYYQSSDLDTRRVMGLGIAMARGSAEALSFCLAVIILTICRNVITLIREWPLGEYIPFDAAITFHKITALFILFWSLVHAAAHCVNFYHLTTQAQSALHCTFHEAIFGPNFLPTISYWFFGTITGLTGLLLVLVMWIIYVFAIPYFMRYSRQAFRFAHLFIYPFYALTVLHGLPKLFASPRFLFYAIGPIVIFVIDRIMGMRQQYKSLQILKATILPSDIIYIQFQRPSSFLYRSGQWLRISSPNFSVQFNEQHAFSIASAPQVPTMELYIKAVGPWTWKLRSEILKAQATSSPYPLIHLQGPYGDGNQEWRSYDVAVLVGAGIGVTPYASTLTDLVLEIRSGRHHNVKCRKVYFLWVCPSHKNYEWFVDVLREIEGDEGEPLLETHIFVTQFFHKYDLRTTMLYICEKHFRGDHAGVSMFTGLRAHNHFGRPNFDAFFKFIQNRHSEVSDVGVFSCGPAAINEQIGAACARANRARNAPSLQHRFETF